MSIFTFLNQTVNCLFSIFFNRFKSVGVTPYCLYRHSLTLRLGLRQLNEHRFKHNFENCINPLCACSLEVDPTKHFFLNCHCYTLLRISFLNVLNKILPQFALLPEKGFTKTLLDGNPIFDESDNQKNT